MDLRTHFIRAAANAAYGFLRNIKQLESNPRIQDMLSEAPEDIVRDRSLTDIAIDDMMARFIEIMAPVRDRDNIPRSLYHWLMIERYGTSVTEEEAHEDLERRLDHAQAHVSPGTVPEFLTAIFPAVPNQILTNITNYWSSVFYQTSRTVASEDALQAQQAYTSTQTAMTENLKKMIEQGQLLDDDSDDDDPIIPADQKNAAPDKSSLALLLKKAMAGNDEDDEDLSDIAQKLAALTLPDDVTEEVWKIYKQTKRLNKNAAEYPVNLKRLETIASLPWGIHSELNNDIRAAQVMLDEDHYGLEKVKEQIIENIAVQLRTGKPNGKILCLVGPPGIGKTSIGKGIARATGRAYGRIALGGVHTESEIRGHRSTYIGAQPGRITKGLQEVGTANPLMLLDEIDKLGSGSTHGDPSAALLEVLDPAQNNSFRDDYTNVPFDLSKVFFLCTANDLGAIPGPLRDRMEIINLSSYLQDEKYEIATRFLIPKQMKDKGLTSDDLVITPEALKTLIAKHTQEAGVRTLERKIGGICSKAVKEIMLNKTSKLHITPENLEAYVGPGHGDRDKIPAVDMVGVVNGLAYSSVGGSVLPIEASTIPSPHGFKMTLSGNLGKVMGESAGVAEHLVRARAPQFGISDRKINKTELVVHCPAGAIPKDGPSAGAAFTTAIISALTGIPVRRDVAMTGEINTRGEVTAIGGLREKLEGALAAGVKTVLLPKQNIPNLNEVPDKIKAQLTVIPVGTIEEVLQHALTRKVEPLITAPRSWTTRLRDAWAVLRNPSNDNTPSPYRQPAGAVPRKLEP